MCEFIAVKMAIQLSFCAKNILPSAKYSRR